MTVGTTQLAPGNGHNYVINGAFDIAQRGVTFEDTTGTFSGSGQYVLDRWKMRESNAGSGATVTVSQETFSAGELIADGFGEINHYMKVDCSVAGSGYNFRAVEQLIEGVRSLAGQTVTLSFYAKSSTSSEFNSIFLRQQTGNGNISTATQSVTLTPSWTRYSLQFTLSDLSGETIDDSNSSLRITFDTDVNEINDYSITGVQLEAGSIATPFKRNANSIQGELAACQRYYYALANDENQSLGVGVYSGPTQIRFHVPFPVAMRSNPSLEVTSGTDYYQLIPGDDRVDDFFILNAHLTGAELTNNTDASGTTGEAGIIRTKNSSSFIAFDAEL